jgi:hypothetical protein
MAEQRALEIDWATAEVQDGVLTAPLTGSVAKAWSEHFNAVLRLLEHSNGGWGTIRLAKKAIEVSDLQAGSEPDLRHFLESVLVQVNSELAPEDREEPEQAAPAADPQQQTDREMTETVRSFADDAQG